MQGTYCYSFKKKIIKQEKKFWFPYYVKDLAERAKDQIFPTKNVTEYIEEKNIKFIPKVESKAKDRIS